MKPSRDLISAPNPSSAQRASLNGTAGQPGQIEYGRDVDDRLSNTVPTDAAGATRGNSDSALTHEFAKWSRVRARLLWLFDSSSGVSGVSPWEGRWMGW